MVIDIDLMCGIRVEMIKSLERWLWSSAKFIPEASNDLPESAYRGWTVGEVMMIACGPSVTRSIVGQLNFDCGVSEADPGPDPTELSVCTIVCVLAMIPSCLVDDETRPKIRSPDLEITLICHLQRCGVCQTILDTRNGERGG